MEDWRRLRVVDGVVRPGTRREVTFRAGAPGTYLYWGTTSGQARILDRTGRDSQLTGAIVIDAAGVARALRSRPPHSQP